MLYCLYHNIFAAAAIDYMVTSLVLPTGANDYLMTMAEYFQG